MKTSIYKLLVTLVMCLSIQLYSMEEHTGYDNLFEMFPDEMLMQIVDQAITPIDGSKLEDPDNLLDYLDSVTIFIGRFSTLNKRCNRLQEYILRQIKLENLQSSCIDTAFQKALSQRRFRPMILLSKKVTISSSITALMHSTLFDACDNNDIKLAKALIHTGININQTNTDYQTPLMVATKNNYEELATYLFHAGAKLDNGVKWLRCRSIYSNQMRNAYEIARSQGNITLMNLFDRRQATRDLIHLAFKNQHNDEVLILQRIPRIKQLPFNF